MRACAPLLCWRSPWRGGTQRASRPVKFWLVENFLSPAFKDFVPKYAEKCANIVMMYAYGVDTNASELQISF